jgi:hypothetical protein
MNLFQEAWLGSLTNHMTEAVVDRSGNGATRRTADRYERLIANSLKEASRVLRKDGWLSIVFSNSNGAMWALLQRAIGRAGFGVDEVTLLQKGQRSVKGLASGFENIVTADLVLSMQKTYGPAPGSIEEPPPDAMESLLDEIVRGRAAATPTDVYLNLIRHYFQCNWNLAGLHIGNVTSQLERAGYTVDSASGRLQVLEPAA